MHCGYASEKRETVSQVIVQRLLKILGRPVDQCRMLDFGCGDGSLSRNFIPHVENIVGLDSSQELVDCFNEKVYNQGLSDDEMKAVLCNEVGEPETSIGRFDLVVSSVVFHHIHDVDTVCLNLSSALKSGGQMLIVDLENIEETVTSTGLVPHKHGISCVDLITALQNSGLTDVEYHKLVPVTLWWKENVDNTKVTKQGRNGETLYMVKRNLMLVRGEKF